jgi:hypothetical protein
MPGRRRVLADEVVQETWESFEQALRKGVYARMLAGEEFHVCDSPEEAMRLPLRGFN